MGKESLEWLKQADYDIKTAKFLFTGKRYFYAVFMCHLAVEKSLKGLYQARLKEVPPKVHNLVYLFNKMGIKPPEDIGKFLVKLNEANVVTRYPEDIDRLKKIYTQSVTKDILAKSQGAIKWIKTLY